MVAAQPPGTADDSGPLCSFVFGLGFGPQTGRRRTPRTTTATRPIAPTLPAQGTTPRRCGPADRLVLRCFTDFDDGGPARSNGASFRSARPITRCWASSRRQGAHVRRCRRKARSPTTPASPASARPERNGRQRRRRTRSTVRRSGGFGLRTDQATWFVAGDDCWSATVSSATSPNS